VQLLDCAGGRIYLPISPLAADYTRRRSVTGRIQIFTSICSVGIGILLQRSIRGLDSPARETPSSRSSQWTWWYERDRRIIKGSGRAVPGALLYSGSPSCPCLTFLMLPQRHARKLVWSHFYHSSSLDHERFHSSRLRTPRHPYVILIRPIDRPSMLREDSGSSADCPCSELDMG
jgi:hypothetical protein